MKIEVLKGFGVYVPGQVFDDWPGGMCQILIGRGLIREVAAAEPLEVAEEEPVTERAEMPARKKRK